MKLSVVAVAIHSNGMIFTMKPPNRHGDVIRMMHESFGIDTIKHGIPSNQGFLLSDGSYSTREAAGVVAIQSQQINSLTHGNQLFSEDLW